MKGILSLYVNPYPISPAEMRKMIEEMEEAITAEFSAEEIEVLRAHSAGFRQHERFLTLDVLEWATGYSKERLSNFQNEGQSHPKHLPVILRVLHERVVRDPALARKAVVDWLRRETGKHRPLSDVPSPDNQPG